MFKHSVFVSCFRSGREHGKTGHIWKNGPDQYSNSANDPVLTTVRPVGMNRKRVVKIMGKGKEYKKLTEMTSLPIQLGLTMAGCIGFCFFVGYYLDKWLNTKGIFLVIFILLGVVGGGYTVYRQIMEVSEDDEKE